MALKRTLRSLEVVDKEGRFVGLGLNTLSDPCGARGCQVDAKDDSAGDEGRESGAAQDVLAREVGIEDKNAYEEKEDAEGKEDGGDGSAGKGSLRAPEDDEGEDEEGGEEEEGDGSGDESQVRILNRSNHATLRLFRTVRQRSSDKLKTLPESEEEHESKDNVAENLEEGMETTRSTASTSASRVRAHHGVFRFDAFFLDFDLC